MGRPKGAKNRKTLLKEGFTPEQLKFELAPYQPLCKCTMCGRFIQKPEKTFPVSKKAPQFRGNYGLANICNSCINEYIAEIKEKYNDGKLAILIATQLLGLYFDPQIYDQFAARGVDVGIGDISRALNVLKYREKNSITYLIEQYEKNKDNDPTKEEYREKRETTKWTAKEQKNKTYCLSVVQHDPFEGVELSDSERKIAFGILANYLGEPGVAEDNYKIQSVIEMVHLHMQCDRINKEISAVLRQKGFDESLVATLTKTKKDLLSAISQLAKDNNIASNYNNTQKAGSNTLTYKMKELIGEGVESLKPDVFDVKTCEAMQQIANLSNKSILEQVSFDAGEYSNIVKEQREIIQTLTSDIDKIKEENRQLENEVMTLNLQLSSRKARK